MRLYILCTNSCAVGSEADKIMKLKFFQIEHLYIRLSFAPKMHDHSDGVAITNSAQTSAKLAANLTLQYPPLAVPCGCLKLHWPAALRLRPNLRSKTTSLRDRRE